MAIIKSVVLGGMILGMVLQAVEKPNVIVVLADDVGYEALGCYGGESYPTPHLDALAESGLQGMHCYSMPVCHPTRIALLTGKYPRNVNNPQWGSFPRDLEGETMAQAMKAQGYGTAVAGKWQLTLLRDDPQQPHRMGFDAYSVFGWHEGARYHQPMVYENGAVNAAAAHRFGPDVYREFLEEFMAQQSDQGKPFFVFYSMALCHDVTDDLDEPVPVSPSGKYLTYAEMVAEMDRQMGLLVRFLERQGLREDTVLIFTTDNGTPVRVISHPEGNELVRVPVMSILNGLSIQGGKGRLDDTGTRVPFLVSWPGVVEAGRRTDALVDMTDFFATGVALAGGAVPRGLDGVSFLPVLRGEPSQREWAYCEGKRNWWVRDQRFKLYDDGRLVEVRGGGTGTEVPVTAPLTSGERRAVQRLKWARPLRGDVQP